MPIPPEFHDPNTPYPTSQTIERLQRLQMEAKARKEQEEKDALNQAIVAQGGDPVVALPEAPALARAEDYRAENDPIMIAHARAEARKVLRPTTEKVTGKDAAGNQGQKL